MVNAYTIEIGFDLHNQGYLIPLCTVKQADGTWKHCDLFGFQSGDTITFLVTDLTDYDTTPKPTQVTPAYCAFAFRPVLPLNGASLFVNYPDAFTWGINNNPSPQPASLYYPTDTSLQCYEFWGSPSEPISPGINGRFAASFILSDADLNPIGTHDPEIFVGAGSGPPKCQVG